MQLATTYKPWYPGIVVNIQEYSLHVGTRFRQDLVEKHVHRKASVFFLIFHCEFDSVRSETLNVTLIVLRLH